MDISPLAPTDIICMGTPDSALVIPNDVDVPMIVGAGILAGRT